MKNICLDGFRWRLHWRGSCRLMLGLSLSLAAAKAWCVTAEGFHFDYELYGWGQPKKLQIFDDAEHTFLWWDANVETPKIKNADTNEALELTRQGSYWVLPGVHEHLVLSFAQGYFHALLAKKVRSSPQLIEAIELDLQEHMAIESAAQTQVLQKSRRSLTAFAHALNMEGSFANSYAQPIRGDVLSWSETQASSRASGKNRNEHDFESDLPGEFDPVSLVNFAKGSKALSAKEKKKIAADLRRIKEPFELTVVGYEDESYLEDLGRKRAEVIESYLLSLGVKAQEVRLQFEPFTEFRSKPSRLEPISAKIIWHRLIEPERLRQSARPALKDPKRVERDLSDLGKAPLGTQAVLEAKAHENSGLIKAGELIHEGLERFANAHHWTLLWQMKWDWKAVADIDLSNERDVVQGVSKVILALRQEGHVLELRVYEDNHVLEVVSSEVFNE